MYSKLVRSLLGRLRWNPEDWETQNVASVAKSGNLGLAFGIWKYGKRSWKIPAFPDSIF